MGPFSTVAASDRLVAILDRGETAMGAAVEGILVERIVLVDRITRRLQGMTQTSPSLPGHLVQMTVTGRAVHESQGRVFEMKPGLTVWFHENEEVRVRVTAIPWSFYTVNFIAPHLPPPAADRRVWRTAPETARHFEDLLKAWTDRASKALVRHIRIQARLLDLLVGVLPAEAQPMRVDPVAQVWWKLEANLRERIHEPVDLDLLHRMSGRSTRTLHRACHRATGMAPLKRIKKMRLSMARSLVLYSSLNISEVAYRVGYERVQELCRDYRRFVGRTPMQDRAAGPDYRRVRPS